MNMLFADHKERILQELDYVLSGVSEETVQSVVQAISGASRVFVGGVGRSGLVMRCFAMRLMHLDREVHVLGDTTTPAAADGDLVIIGSGSGRTPSLVARAEKARVLGCRIVLITGAQESPLRRLAHQVIEVPISDLISHQPLGNLFEQAMLLTCEIIIMKLMDGLGITQGEMFRRHANIE
ncbi:6-phospho-3-hexuloisomerase [Candidatus Darwinibacter acetoxidans]|jgi:6-phospho-3-hexuloisomerase|nr:SIS domain-containing protein [Limnochordia bacterium]MDI9464755.1 SIS domain-containing protein [Bacillota bacterium]HBG09865.1 6-phospho-3-hexuloisomerase [Bacillota bacterium]